MTDTARNDDDQDVSEQRPAGETSFTARGSESGVSASPTLGEPATGNEDIGTVAFGAEMAGVKATAGTLGVATDGPITTAADDDEAADPGATEGIAVPGDVAAVAPSRVSRKPGLAEALERVGNASVVDEPGHGVFHMDDDDDEEAEALTGGIEKAKADRVVIRQGGAGQVEAREVHIEQGGAGRVEAEELSITQGGVGFARTGELELGADGNAFFVVADEVEVEPGGRIGILLARSVSGDVRPAMDLRSAAVFGAAFAIVGALLRRVRGR